MWLAEMAARDLGGGESAAEIGRVSIGGVPAGVLTDGERREVGLSAPGGYLWRPAAEQDVLLIRTGDGERLVAGAVSAALAEELEAGEICLRTPGGGTKVWLKNDGTVAVTGDVELRGDVELQGEARVQGDVGVVGTLSITGTLLLNGVRIAPGLI